MSTFKKTKVVMLSTNEKATMALSGNKLSLKTKALQEESQHLYFLSDEEIKEGDWYISAMKSIISQHNGTEKLPDGWKKIIATTNSNLTIKTLLFVQGENKEIDVLLPQPSTLFIEKFVEEYNKGNVITEVLVEYEEVYQPYFENHKFNKNATKSQLKISKDNTITIRKAKDSWSREEVKVILEKAIYEREQFLNKSGTLSYNFDKWIEENL